MTVSLLMPIGFNDPRRTQIYQWTLARWFEHFPSWQFCVGQDDDIENYNRSAARNAAFSQADGDILVITDADTATTKENVKEAIRLCGATNQWVIAHKMYYSLREEFTTELLQKPPVVDIKMGPFDYDWKMLERSEAGVLVMPREAFEKVQGYDERFKGWGWEDSAFAAKMRKLWSAELRTEGEVFHLWHPRGNADFSQPHIKYNEKLFEGIRDACDL